MGQPCPLGLEYVDFMLIYDCRRIKPIPKKWFCAGH